MDTWKKIVYEVIDSTNSEARRMVENAECAGTVIVAGEQTAGRGRRGRQWSSPRGENLYFSMVLCPEMTAEECSALTLVMGLSVAESIRKLTGAEALIKWPNDIVIGGRKVCGILAEMVLDGTSPKAVIVGVGVNVGARTFPPELTQTATTLEQVCGEKISAEKLLDEILQHFEKQYRIFCKERAMHSLLEPYNALLANRDRQVCVLEPGAEYTGMARGINEKGELLVELPDGKVMAVYAGEVSVRGIYGYI